MTAAEGFTWLRRKNGDVVIFHRGRLATTLRGARAERFVVEVGDGDSQARMARLTGNYKRGNEARPGAGRPPEDTAR